MTESSARTQLEEMERDRLSVYVTRSRVPRWYFPFLGITTGLMLASYELPHPAMTVAVVLVYVAGMGALVGWLRGKEGIWPRYRGMPGPLLLPIVVYFVVVGTVVAGGAIATLFFDVPWSHVHLGVVAGLVLWLGGWLAFWSYDRRAERLAAEAGIER